MVVLRHLAFLGIIRFTLRIMTDVAADAFHRVQRFSTEWHANSFAGSTVRKISRGMWALDLLNDTILVALLPSIVVLVGSALVLSLYWPMMGLLVILGAAAYVAMTATLSLAYVAPAARLANQWDTRLGGALADAVSCNAVVKAFGAEAREDQRLARVLDKWRRRTDRTWLRGTYNGTAQMTALLILRAAIIGAVLWLWWQGRATPGDVTYVLTTFFVIQGYLRDVGMHIRNLQRSVNDMEELVEFHAEPIGVPDRAGAAAIAIGGGEIVFDRVTFHYGGHATALYRDFSVRIAPGEKVGLVGRSGSGKTTFVKLIQRLYDLNEGRILIDGHDVASATQASLRAQIAIVQQEPILFHRSLAENIAYGRPGATLAEIERAAVLANAHDFIVTLPNGYRTMVGERGIKLSGGERQRVALARAFLADAPILILDEATSSLDSEFGASGAGGDAAAAARPHRDRHRAPPLHGAGNGPHPGLRARADRRGGRPRRAHPPRATASTAACSRSRRARWRRACRWREGTTEESAMRCSGHPRPNEVRAEDPGIEARDCWVLGSPLRAARE